MNPTTNTPTTPSPTNPTSAPSESFGALNIQPGKFYRTRDGRKYECLKVGVRFRADEGSGIAGLIYENGLATSTALWMNGQYLEHTTSNADLIAEWVDRPEIDWSLMPERAVAVTKGLNGVWRAYAFEPTYEHNRGWRSVGDVWILYPQHVPKNWTGDSRDSLVVKPEGAAQ